MCEKKNAIWLTISLSGVKSSRSRSTVTGMYAAAVGKYISWRIVSTKTSLVSCTLCKRCVAEFRTASVTGPESKRFTTAAKCSAK